MTILKQKDILQKVTFEIDPMKFFVSKKLKILSLTYLIEDLHSEENVGTFYEK